MPQPSMKLIYLLAFATVITCTGIAAHAYLKVRNRESITIYAVMVAAFVAVLLAVWATD